MAMRFRRSTKIAPGVKVNLSKKNVGVTVGTKGAHYSVNSSGRKTTTVGVPGTGVSFVDVSSKKGGDSAQVTAEPRPVSKGVYIAMLIVAILWTIALGLPLLTISPVIGVLLIAVGVYVIILAVKGIKLYKKTPSQHVQPQPVPTEPVQPIETPAPVVSAPVAPPAPTNEEGHKVAGLSFREDALAELQCENGDYSCSKRELVEMGMIGERIYKFDFYPIKTELIPEPDNEVDPNAIKVVVDGLHIGYIKKGSCAHIHKLLNSGSIEKIDIEIGGGPYKFIEEDWDDFGNSVYTLEKDTTPYYAKLTITKK